MAIDEADFALFLSLETSLHRPEIRSSPDLVGRLLADEFIEFGRSGRVYNKSVTIEALAAEDVANPVPLPQVSDLSATRLSHDVVLVTYKSIRETTESQEVRQTLRSSIYRHQDGRWQMIFHQGTPIPLDRGAISWNPVVQFLSTSIGFRRRGLILVASSHLTTEVS